MITAVKESQERKQAPPRAAHHPWWRVAFELLLLAAVAIAVLEGFFRLCGVGGQEFLEPDIKLGVHQIPGQQVTWRFEGFSSDRLNSTGRRDVEHSLAKPPGTARIAVLGDSATEGLQVALKDTYCRVLDGLLNAGAAGKFEVLNFGCSSYSTGQQVLMFEKDVLPYRPDIIVLLYVRGSGLINVYNPFQRNVDPRPYFYLDRQGTLVQDNSILREQEKNLRPNAVLDFLRRNSRIYGVFSQTNFSLSIHEKLYTKIKGWLTKQASLGQPKPTGHPGRILYSPQDPWPVTRALLHRLNQDCRRNGSKLIVAAFPNTIGDPILAQQIPELEKLSQSEGFAFLDLTPAFQADNNPGSLFLQYHFSAAGHKLAAKELHKFLRDKHVITSIKR